MRLEAVTVCVNYADFLAETARHNRHIFDRWMIVTRPEDRETIAVCKAHNLECITSTEFAREGEGFTFNKGRAISLGLSQLSAENWILHLDADIVLPRDTLRCLRMANLDSRFIYGADRICLRSWDEWKKLESQDITYRQHGHQLVAMPPPGELGCRLVRPEWGYVPIGFFQLWHGSYGVHEGWRYVDYPHTNSTAAHSDIKFALRWPRDQRALVPELFVIHLESEKVQFGANWRGRKTARFGPPGGQEIKNGLS